MKIIIISFLAAAYTVLMSGCAGGNPRTADGSERLGHVHGETCRHDHPHEEDEGGESPEHPHGESAGGGAADEIIFPESQAARVNLEVEEIVPAPFRNVIRASGDIAAAQGDEQAVVAPVAGIVSFARSGIAPGMKVGKGDPLFYISSKNIAGGDAAARAKAAYDAAAAEYERAAALLPDRIVSQREYDEARRGYLDAKNEWEALSAGSTERGNAVRAPFSGYISSLSVAEGGFAEVGQRLAVVSQDIRHRLVALVPQRYYAELSGIRNANIAAPDGRIVELASLGGRLVSAGRSLAAGSTLIPVIFEFDAHPSLIPGSTVEAYLLGAERQGVLAVPAGALAESQGLYFVFEQVDSEGYLKHEVTPGASDGQRVEILSGLEPGMRIVTRGAVHVKMATASSIPHSHQH